MGNKLAGDADSTAAILSFLDLRTVTTLAENLYNCAYQSSIRRSLKCGSLATVHAARWHFRGESHGQRAVKNILNQIGLFGPSLRSLELQRLYPTIGAFDGAYLTSAQFGSIVTRCTNLDSIRVDGFDFDLTPASCPWDGTKAKSLIAMDLQLLTFVRDPAWIRIAPKFFAGVVSLKLSGLNIENEGLTAIFDACRDTLQTGDFRLTNLGSEAFEALPSSLRKLSVCDCRYTSITTQSIKTASRNLTNLTYLEYYVNDSYKASDRPTADDALVAWCTGGNAANLRSLFFYGPTSISGVGCKAIAKHCRNLTSLSLPETKVTTSMLLLVLNACTELEELYLRGSENCATDEFLAAVTQLCHLKKLDLSYCGLKSKELQKFVKKVGPKKTLTLLEVSVKNRAHAPQKLIAKFATMFPHLKIDV